MVEGTVDTSGIVACLKQFSQQIDKTTSVLLDNAPMHRSQACIEQMPQWVKQGLILKYLPSYAPALHLIEILWRFMQYSWLPFSAYASFQCLVAAGEAILTRFGTEYTINFQAA
jgi:DDE superfamily endonuclease